MSNQKAVDILNELLQYESESVLPRLGDTGMVTSWASMSEARIVDQIIEEQAMHMGWIVDAIDRLGGYPKPVVAGIHLTNLHYVDLGYLLAKIIDDMKTLVTAYDSAASQVGSCKVAAEVIAKIADRHRRHIEQLSKFKTGNVEPNNA
jgi:hypothetical protein